jgi:hypothetical protein
MCFLTRAQDISWSNTPIYQTFRQLYPVWQPSPTREISNRTAENFRVMYGTPWSKIPSTD